MTWQLSTVCFCILAIFQGKFYHNFTVWRFISWIICVEIFYSVTYHLVYCHSRRIYRKGILFLCYSLQHLMDWEGKIYIFAANFIKKKLPEQNLNLAFHCMALCWEEEYRFYGRSKTNRLVHGLCFSYRDSVALIRFFWRPNISSCIEDRGWFWCTVNSLWKLWFALVFLIISLISYSRWLWCEDEYEKL